MNQDSNHQPKSSRPWQRKRGLWVLLLLTSLTATGAALSSELLRDPRFQQGFILLEPKPGKRVPYGELATVKSGDKPAWDLAQWSSKFPLDDSAAPPQPMDLIVWGNKAKSVTIGKPGSAEGDVSLRVIADTEYGTKARASIEEPWVHLLLQQEFDHAPKLSELESLRFHAEARLLRSTLVRTNDHNPALHAAQYLIYFSVGNRNRQSPGYGQGYWFGIPVYDNRTRVIPSYEAKDFGGTSLFIFTLSSDTFSKESTHDGTWVTFEKDLLPLMRQGLEHGWARGFMPGSRSFSDYQPTSIYIGWEVPGVFDVEVQLRNLSVQCLPQPKGQ